MRYRFFTIPVADPGPAQDEMDAFIAAHRILSVAAPTACRWAVFHGGAAR